MKQSISKNIVSAFIYQLCQVISGLIIPRLILQIFGSDVNGLVSSITQFSNYVTLLEGGITGVMTANLYKPLIENDEKRLSSLMITINSFYKKIAIVIIVYQVVLAFIFPCLVKDDFDKAYVFSLVIILGINLFIQYSFSLPYKILLDADNKLYYTNMVMAATSLINTIVTYMGVKLFPNIHVIKLFTAIVYLLQPLAYGLYVKRSYKFQKNVDLDPNALSQRWSGFGINLAAFIHANTDIVILALFCNVYIVSVYSLYNYVANAGRMLVNVVISSFVPLLGKKIAGENFDELNDYFDIYEFISLAVIFAVFTIISILIVPFEMLYTRGVTDTDYYQPLFAFIMVFAEMVYCIRTPYIHYAYQSGRFREISKYAYTEAIINIIVSVTTVYAWGLVGVALGTSVSMVYRLVMQARFASNGMKRDSNIYKKYCLIFGTIFLLLNFIFRQFPIYYIYNIKAFLSLVIFTAISTIIIYALSIRIFFKENYAHFKSLLFR